MVKEKSRTRSRTTPESTGSTISETTKGKSTAAAATAAMREVITQRATLGGRRRPGSRNCPRGIALFRPS